MEWDKNSMHMCTYKYRKSGQVKKKVGNITCSAEECDIGLYRTLWDFIGLF